MAYSCRPGAATVTMTMAFERGSGLEAQSEGHGVITFGQFLAEASQKEKEGSKIWCLTTGLLTHLTGPVGQII